MSDDGTITHSDCDDEQAVSAVVAAAATLLADRCPPTVRVLPSEREGTVVSREFAAEAAVTAEASVGRRRPLCSAILDQSFSQPGTGTHL
jgi:hypothetical protein